MNAIDFLRRRVRVRDVLRDAAADSFLDDIATPTVFHIQDQWNNKWAYGTNPSLRVREMTVDALFRVWSLKRSPFD